MSKLHVIFDPTEKLEMVPELTKMGIKVAQLSIPDDLDDRDIYEIARKLAELLLEQIA